ncbi:hypothetical protein BDY21DRAFT_356513 [Lineolata rhizophorae]|uniref:Uncharacterized protein n=1 Tax=Lineolata rhizophorae TaxID=578093 RepID=A0A6A6NNM0_9PEZI|nr:hypothetical protein BDY21DRAFT_356513 [Lineolata rhizophorae]
MSPEYHLHYNRASHKTACLQLHQKSTFPSNHRPSPLPTSPNPRLTNSTLAPLPQTPFLHPRRRP